MAQGVQHLPPEEIDRLLAQTTVSVKEYAAIMRTSENTAYASVRAGQVPSIEVGRSIKIPTAALRQMLHLGGVK